MNLDSYFRLNPETEDVVPVARVSEHVRDLYDVPHKVIHNLVFGPPQPTSGRHSASVINPEVPLIALFLPYHRVGAIPYLALSMVIQSIG